MNLIVGSQSEVGVWGDASNSVKLKIVSNGDTSEVYYAMLTAFWALRGFRVRVDKVSSIARVRADMVFLHRTRVRAR